MWPAEQNLQLLEGIAYGSVFDNDKANELKRTTKSNLLKEQIQKCFVHQADQQLLEKGIDQISLLGLHFTSNSSPFMSKRNEDFQIINEYFRKKGLNDLATKFQTTIQEYARNGDEFASEILNDMHQFLMYGGDINSLLKIGTTEDYSKPPPGPIPAYRQGASLGRSM